MNARTSLLAGLAASALVALAPSALAQTGAAPPAASIAQGPPISGYCVVFINGVIGNSKVGQSVIQRLNVLTSQVKAELQPQGQALATDERAFEAQRASMDQATLQAKGAALQQRDVAFQRLEQLRSQELQATQQKQLAEVVKQLGPIVTELYQQRHCSILVDGDSSVKIVNPAMDLSSAAVTALDARIQTLTFDREHLDTPAAGAAGR